MKKYILPLLLLAITACGAKAQTAADAAPQDKVIAVADRQAAPDFTLNDINGKPLSLSDLKGKWVILDFWGSWCPWCIKGFPALKEAYKQYGGKVEVLGIDCGDTEEAWKESVAKHELPWLQVYNPKGTDLTAQYGIQGFPTKFIIDPEGRVANVTIGEDPAFFEVLSTLVK
ncbi:MAG: TlpA family protein disulfide reductase [Bacteroides sp.]|nr:TlpA family protein disulfide reductase [Bacteroides sp.]MBD5419684.1 TlpA family protein disulfide reductase [Bacteroides sp.]